jgi:hypothetical protein
MTTYQKWQMPRFEAVAGKTGLAFGENSTLLKREQDFAEDRWATGSFELGNSCKRIGQLTSTSWATHANKLGNSHQQVGQLASTRWATRVNKMGKHKKTGRLIKVSRPVHWG